MTLPLPTSLDRESVARWLAREICCYRDVLEQDYESADAVLALLAREVEKEREACAKVCDEEADKAQAHFERMDGVAERVIVENWRGARSGAIVCAEAIRARSAVTDRGHPETSPSGDTGGAS